MIHRFGRLAALLIAGLSLSTFVLAQTSGVDPTFNAVPSLELTSASATGQVLQPDGKVLIFGHDFVVEGIAKGDIARINVDGTLDTTFNYCGCVITSVGNMMLAPDGKIVVAGGSPGFGRMMRLLPDGTVDPTFSVAVADTFFGGTGFTINAVLADGKVYASRRDVFQGHVNITLRRYNSDGTVDAGFTAIQLGSGSPMSAYARIAVLPDGKFYLAATSGVTGTGSTLKRYNPDGSIDPSYEQPSFSTGNPPSTQITDIVLEANGNLLVTGRFTSVNGTGRTHLVRLFPAGNVDLNFPNAGPNALNGVGLDVLPDGKILFSANVDIATAIKIFRLNTGGSVDKSYQFDPSIISLRSTFRVDAAQRTVFWAITTSGIRLTRLLSTGARDTTFNPTIAGYGRIQAAAVQPDGKVIMAGQFSAMGAVAKSGLARVNADGSADPTFDPGTGFSSVPSKLLVQPDGKILAIGVFASYNGAAQAKIVRINSDGSRDATFNPVVSDDLYAIALEPDGQILIGGNFSTVNGTTRTGLARLNSDGTLDTSFNPTIGSPQIRAIVVDTDGKIGVGGAFSGVNGFSRSNLVRLNSNGTLDTLFGGSHPEVYGLNLSAGGRYLLTLANRLSRVNGDGTADATFQQVQFSFNTGNPNLDAVLVRQDGSIVVGGRFDTVGTATRRNITRLAPNGAHDPLFLPGGSDQRVATLADYSAEKIIAGGDFTVIDGVSKPGIARLNIVSFRAKTAFDFNGDGRADYSVYRPSTGVWYELFAGGSAYEAPTFGIAGDIPVPADYDGDGKTDEAIFRPAYGEWWYFSSSTGGYIAAQTGANGDIPRPADIDGDGKADFVTYRPGNRTWYRAGSATGVQIPFAFGLAGDQPVSGDFDGDGKGDIAIFRPSTGEWWYAASGSGNAFRAVRWGQNGDIPVPADFDGDGRTDYAVFRPSEGGWYVNKSGGGAPITMAFGVSGDRPVPADYDGDGRADVAVFRPSSGIWYLYQSTAGFVGLQWGLSSDIAVPNAFAP